MQLNLATFIGAVTILLSACHGEEADFENIEAEIEGGKATVELISGEFKIPGPKFAKLADYKLVGKMKIASGQRFVVQGNFDLNGNTLEMNTGGGNETTFPGVLSGNGNVIWSGGGNPHWQTIPSFLKGDVANTFTGTLTITHGTLALAKKPGVAAFSGDWIVLGGGRNQAILRLDAADQVKDTSGVRFTGKHVCRIWTQGNSESLGQLGVQAHGTISMGDGECTLKFADSSGLKWDLAKTLTVEQWTAGKDKLVFGNGKSGLTKEQLGRIGFLNPSGQEQGIYSAQMLPNGELTPHERVQPQDPPFPLTESARKEREAIYSIPGRARLSGKGSPLKDGMTISLFGDSITWQNAFISKIGEALKAGEGTSSMKVRLINRGINGGGVLSIKDGTDKSAYVSAKQRSGPQAAFAEVIKADASDVAVVYIGINDVWWRKTTPEVFVQALKDIVASARKRGTIPVLATLSVWRELPDGKNPGDTKCDQYAQLTRDVAAETDTVLVDLRKGFMAYIRNHNATLRVDGTLDFVPTGILTYDGVHPNSKGNELLADLIAQGIFEALKEKR